LKQVKSIKETNYGSTIANSLVDKLTAGFHGGLTARLCDWWLVGFVIQVAGSLEQMSHR